MAVILVTNDDGAGAEGLKTLEEILKGLAHVVVVAPDQERSAVSHALTLHSSISYQAIGSDRYILNGTPADCVIFALRHLFAQPPDMVISGINHGANLGDDIMYSGTVAAAREASRHGIPAMAISQAYYDGRPIHFKEGAPYVRDLIAAMLRNNLNGEICLNVNIPVGNIRGIKITRQGCEEHIPHFNALDYKLDYDDLPFARAVAIKSELMSDRQAIREQYISITPLQRDLTDYSTARILMGEADRFFSLR